jgi:WD40 repeat protein
LWHHLKVSSVFVSHAAVDAAWAATVGHELGAAHYGPVFVSSAPELGIDAGRLWERELYEQLRSARVVIFLCTPASLESRWCFAELALARALQKPIFPVAADGCGPHPLLADFQQLAAPGAGLATTLRRAGLEPQGHVAWDPARPLYPGLASFAAEDAGVFFGREAETAKLERRLQRRLLDEEPRAVVVVGASGSGKSSLIHAGLVPALQRRSDWLVLPGIVPGGDPLAQLALALDDAGATPGAELGSAVVELARRARSLGPVPSVLLVVDQLEELFTQCGEHQRAAFLTAVTEVLADPSSPLWMLASLRSEFIPRALAEARLVPILQRQMPLGPLDRDALRAVIRGPAAVAGLSFEPELVETMVADATGEDALPLLAFTLQELHAQRDGPRPIDRADYARIGGVEGALRAHADATTAGLAEAGIGREEVLDALETLVLLGPDRKPVRQRLPLEGLTGRRRTILDLFVTARLLTTASSGGRPTITVAHEALLRAWPPLAHAIDEHQAQLEVRTEIDRAAQEWDANDRSPGYLITGERLQRALRWLELDPAATPVQRAFIAAAEQRDEASLRREAEQLANTVLAGVPNDPELAILLGIAALEHYARPPRAIRGLIAALAASRVREVLEPGVRATSLSWSPDGARLAVATAAGVGVWDVAARTWVRRIEQPGVRGVAFSRSGRRLALACDDAAVRVLDADTGAVHHVLHGHERSVTCVAWADDAVVTGSEDRTVRLWYLGPNGPALTFTGHQSEVNSVQVSADDRLIASGSADGRAILWNLGTGELAREFQIHPYLPGFEEEVYAARFSPGDAYLATAAVDHHLATWAIDQRGHDFTYPGHPGTWCVDWSPRSWELVSGGSDRVARIWGINSAVARAELVGHAGGVSRVAWQPTGALIASGGEDGVRLWRAHHTGAEQHLTPDRMSERVLGWSPTGAGLLTARHGEIQRWQGEPLSSADVWVVDRGEEGRMGEASASWSPDGSRVLTVGGGLATVRSGAEARTLRAEGYVKFAAWAPDGERIATANVDGRVDIDGAGAFATPRYVECLHWSADGRRLVVANAGGARVFDAATGAALLEFTGAAGRIEDAAESPDGTRLVVVAFGDVAYVTDGARAIDLTGHSARVLGAAWSPAGETIATWSTDGTCRLWDPESGAPAFELRHLDQVFAAAWAPAGDRLLTASADGNARIWDAATGAELARLEHPADRWVVACAWSHDGRRVATSDHQDAFVWDATTDPDELIRIARSRVFRDLTVAERHRFGLERR